MGRVERERLTGPVALRLLIRGLLLASVLSGIFGMHVLTADDGGTGHGALPVISAAGHDGMTEPDAATSTATGAITASAENTGGAPLLVAAAAVLAPDPGSGMGHGAMTGCILFLAAGAAALLAALLRQRRITGSTGPGRFARTALTDLRRRGPPGRYRSRAALCVIRI